MRTEVDRDFRGAEHMLAGAPLISPLPSKIDFPSLLRSMSMLRSRCYKRIECWVAIPSDQYWSDRCWRFYFDFLRLHFYPRLFALPSSLFFCLSLLAAFPEEKINARQLRAKSCARFLPGLVSRQRWQCVLPGGRMVRWLRRLQAQHWSAGHERGGDGAAHPCLSLVS